MLIFSSLVKVHYYDPDPQFLLPFIGTVLLQGLTVQHNVSVVGSLDDGEEFPKNGLGGQELSSSKHDWKIFVFSTH